MEHIFRGRVITGNELNHYLLKLDDTINQDLMLPPIDTEIVISAIWKLVEQTDFADFKQQLIENGQADWKAESLIQSIKKSLTPTALHQKIVRELGDDFYKWVEVEPGIQERQQPLGVLFHIGAGNVLALSVLSVLEGLLTGNINVLKLPSYEGGISLTLLKRLVMIEPRLAPYIYVFDISSEDVEILKKLGNVADAIVVWGSDNAIHGIRQIAPAHLPIIQWGHRLSFAYLTPGQHSTSSLEQLAKEICLSDQQFCSSPQCLFVETDDMAVIDTCAKKLKEAMTEKAKKYPAAAIQIHDLAEITWTKELVKMASLLGQQQLVESDHKDFSIMMDKQPSLKTSPLYRNIWLMPIKRSELLTILRIHKGHLQTAGLACHEEDYDDLSNLFYRAGVTRVTTFGNMSQTYVGEPHDGKPTLLQYTRTICRNKN
ncbi:Acyl-CoA reductase [Petrocella atlantisensis]|uniref:Acyl-CoA reductase n=1 Tax=Petrocella atlantisensis TaxID=2173034 RepID=A0A3P7Q0Q2_9FIRM|nr:acyl-CoA reductase [Petrocella atlantisensis]VDN48971.1 Acyl-CoA reductase [Petrocella atlantisensis]